METVICWNYKKIFELAKANPKVCFCLVWLLNRFIPKALKTNLVGLWQTNKLQWEDAKKCLGNIFMINRFNHDEHLKDGIHFSKADGEHQN